MSPHTLSYQLHSQEAEWKESLCFQRILATDTQKCSTEETVVLGEPLALPPFRRQSVSSLLDTGCPGPSAGPKGRLGLILQSSGNTHDDLVSARLQHGLCTSNPKTNLKTRLEHCNGDRTNILLGSRWCSKRWAVEADVWSSLPLLLSVCERGYAQVHWWNGPFGLASDAASEQYYGTVKYAVFTMGHCYPGWGTGLALKTKQHFRRFVKTSLACPLLLAWSNCLAVIPWFSLYLLWYSLIRDLPESAVRYTAFWRAWRGG